MLKMYILIKNTVQLGLAVNAAAHAGLIGYLEFRDLPETKEWLEKSFRKVTCSVTPEKFEKLKHHFLFSKIITESALGNEEVAIVIAPMDKVPKVLKALPLYAKGFSSISQIEQVSLNIFRENYIEKQLSQSEIDRVREEWR